MTPAVGHMKILFVNTHYYLPQSFGGMAMTAHQLCRGMQQKGHQVAMLAGFRHGGWFAAKSALEMKIRAVIGGHKLAYDTTLGYPVWRSWDPVREISYVAAQEKPDLVVVMGGKVVAATLAARRSGLPVLAQIHDVEFHFHDGDFRDIGNVPCVANSRFTAETYRRAFGIPEPAVIYPFIPAELYKTPTSRENITFINPYLYKGCSLGLEIVRLCPDIPFRFVGSMPERDESGTLLAAKTATLPNLTCLPPQPDLRAVYASCKILLVPSQWEETYGRVVTEAQISGIPVVASSRGGLPESVGPGGILLKADDPAELWGKTLRDLWYDDARYVELSAAAVAYAGRPEMDPIHQLDAHEKAMLAALRVERP